jgi:hypothetical protein
MEVVKQHKHHLSMTREASEFLIGLKHEGFCLSSNLQSMRHTEEADFERPPCLISMGTLEQSCGSLLFQT